MSTPGATTSGLSGAVAEARAAAGEAGHRVGRRRPRRRSARRRPQPGDGDRRRTSLPLLPAAMTNRRRRARRQLVDRLAQRVGAVAGVAAQAHADDVGALVDGPLHAGEHPGVLAGCRASASTLPMSRLGAGGDALVQCRPTRRRCRRWSRRRACRGRCRRRRSASVREVRRCRRPGPSGRGGWGRSRCRARRPWRPCRRSRPPRPRARGSAATRVLEASACTRPSRSTRVAPSASAVGAPAASAPVGQVAPEPPRAALVHARRPRRPAAAATTVRCAP